MLKSARTFCVALAVLLGFSAIGCGPKPPEGMPKTYPFKVKVVDGSTPIEKVDVTLLDGNKPLVRGTTDQSGVAPITTKIAGSEYVGKGAPEGEFKVKLVKERLAEHWKTPQELAEMSTGDRAAYYDEYNAKCEEIPLEVPLLLGKDNETPLTVSVTSAGGELVVDVAEYK